MSKFRSAAFTLVFLSPPVASFLLGACTQQTESPAPAGSEAPSVEERPNCPTCGMYADMTPEWQATIEYQDGSVLYFDVPEHMLAFYISPVQHQATDYHKDLNNIAHITVTDYESKSPIDASQAFYVVGSDVKSPMGEGVVPFRSKETAEEFRAQNGGRILVFSDLTEDMIREIQ